MRGENRLVSFRFYLVVLEGLQAGRSVGEAPYLQRLGRLEEGGQLGLRDVDFARVHELHQGDDVLRLDVAHEYYRVLARIALKSHVKWYSRC